MATIKSFTDLSQSDTLSKILPLESADMNWHELPPIGLFVRAFPYKHDNGATEGIFPCWSLSALLNIFPQEIFDGEYIINITEGCDNRWVVTYDHYENRNHSYPSLSIGADNLIDACYEMILKLHKLNLL